MGDLSGWVEKARDLPQTSGLSEVQKVSWGEVLADADFSSKLMIGGAVFLLFLFIALVQRKIWHFTMSGAVMGIVVGVILVLMVEAALVFGGKTAYEEVVVGGNGPEAVQQVATEGFGRLTRVLGVTNLGVPEPEAESEVSAEAVLENFLTLPASEAARVYETICKE